MRRILVPLDGSDRGDLILTFLDRMLPESRGGIELILLRVLARGEALDVAHERTAATTKRLWDKGVRALSLVVVGDEVPAEVLKLAELTHPWLVALSTHGAGDSRRRHGSVAERLVEATPGPLLLVGRQALPLDPAAGLNRVLVALDGSRSADGALSLVGELARPSDAEVVLLSVDTGAAGAVDLEGARARLLQAGVDRVRALTAAGDVAEALLATARREGVDLLALGARGATGGPGLGSVARAVAQGCDCPLLLTR